MPETSEKRRMAIVKLEKAVALLCAGALLAPIPAGVAMAQENQLSATQRQAAALNLPEITVMGTVDPNVRKATAIVNGDIITDTDVDHRLGLVIIANGGKKISF